jgi:hypothetical protein
MVRRRRDDALDGDSLVENLGTDSADGTENAVLGGGIERVVGEGVEGAVRE